MPAFTGRTKPGQISKAEKAFILANNGKMHVEDIAAKLRRHPDVILRVLTKDAGATLPTAGTAAATSLRISAAWRGLTAQFEPEELAFFEEQYTALYEQFKEDVLPTEENQIFKVITLEILKTRNAIQQKAVQSSMHSLRSEHELMKRNYAIKGRAPSAADQSRMQMLNEQIEISEKSLKDLIDTYVKLEEKHQKLMEALKATRQQRIDKIEKSGVSFMDLIRLLQDEDTRKYKDREASLMIRAAEKELDRLAKPYVYADNIPDIPILNADTIMREE